MSGKAHGVTRRGTTPSGTKIQVEDWSGAYPFLEKPFMLVAYPPVVNAAAITDEHSRYLHSNAPRMRVSFEYPSLDECEGAFERIEGGDATLRDRLPHISYDHIRKNHVGAVNLD